ncbi:Uncharacterised protein [Mycobacteroides abscessus subsp. abscessus]|nr:Uncharacterised protein [Mycobacteroides abscessus subsp. abscessus]
MSDDQNIERLGITLLSTSSKHLVRQRRQQFAPRQERQHHCVPCRRKYEMCVRSRRRA